MKQVIIKLLKKNIGLPEKQINEIIEIPPSIEMGDYAFPCFVLSKKLRKSPNQIAEELKQKIKLPREIISMEVAGPYLNFFIDKKILSRDIIKEIISKKEKYGQINKGRGKKIIIEHTSINPNASPHVGRARNAIIGDSIVRILTFAGFKPEVHYYINDVSKQIAMLVLAKAENLSFDKMLKKYIEISKKVKKSPELEQQVFESLRKFEQRDKTTLTKFRKTTKTCVDGQRKILSDLGISYDKFDYESDFIPESRKILEKLKATKKLHRDSDGRFYLDLSGTRVENKMKSPVLVLTRSDETGLYPLRDLAYSTYKSRLSKSNFIILGEDQKLYLEQLSEALKLLGVSQPIPVHYSFILLTEKGKSKKMSTRKGDVVLLEDFMEKAINKAKKEISKRKNSGDPREVGISAVKYSILKNHPNKMILFNLDDALSFEGDTGPYLLYSYARASSIIRKSKSNIKKDFKIAELKNKEIELVKKLSEFPKVIESSYKNLNPSYIANYSYQLSKIFNEFYHECPVIGYDNEEFRLAVVQSFRIILKKCLNLLGINVIEEM